MKTAFWRNMKAGTAVLLAGAIVVGALLTWWTAVGLMIVLLIGMVSASVLAHRVDVAPKQVLRRLLPSLTGVMLLLLAGAFALLWWQQHRQMEEIRQQQAVMVLMPVKQLSFMGRFFLVPSYRVFKTMAWT